jgi:hypothetical protein
LPDDANEHIESDIRLGDSTVMLSAAKHLASQHNRPFASLRVTVLGSISSSVVFFETASSFWNVYTSSQIPLDNI